VGVGLRQSAEHTRQDHFTLRIDLRSCRLLRKLAPTFSVIPAKAGIHDFGSRVLVLHLTPWREMTPTLAQRPLGG